MKEQVTTINGKQYTVVETRAAAIIAITLADEMEEKGICDETYQTSGRLLYSLIKELGEQ